MGKSGVGLVPTTRVSICDDHEIFREGLKAVLQDESWIEIVGEAKDGREAVALAIREKPDVALMDVEMPEMTGLEATVRMREAGLRTKVLILTVYAEDALVARCLDAGAYGYVLKDEPASQLVYALRTVSEGGRYLSPWAARSVIARSLGAPRAEQARTRYDSLTPREREILKLLADGRSVKDIAASLALSLKTVDSHKTNLMRKLGVHDRTELLKYALQNRLLRLPFIK
jgi:two-component system, NarL family, response regulator NreC